MKPSEQVPEEFRTRLRGRSVPSPRARSAPEAQVHVLERYIFSYELPQGADYKFLMLASSDLYLDKWSLRVSDEKPTKGAFYLEAVNDNDIIRHTFDIKESGTTSSEKDTGFGVLRGEILSVGYNSLSSVYLTLEFVRDGRTISRTV